LTEPDPKPLSVLLTRNRNAWIAPVCLSGEKWPTKVKNLPYPKTYNIVDGIFLAKVFQLCIFPGQYG
jgi:hypothetical protein